MQYSVKALDGEPIVLVTVGAVDPSASDSAQAMDEISALLDAQRGGAFLVFDLLEASFSMDELIAGTNLATRGKHMLDHPNVIEILTVTRSGLIGLASQGLSHPLFGGIKIRVFESLPDALRYARSVPAHR